MGEKREVRDGSLKDTTIFTVLSVQEKNEGDEVLIYRLFVIRLFWF